jgi:hypothetical protein
MPPAGVEFRVAVGGDGLGSVTFEPPNQPAQTCPEACTAIVAPGTDLLLTASPGLNSLVRGWSIPGCGSTDTCRVHVDADTSMELTLELAFNVAFTTSQVYSASGVPRPGAEANQECARLAGAAGLHGSRFVAWLSAEGSTTDVADDVTPSALFQHRGGWVRTDGEPVARSLAALTRGEVLHPIELDEQRNLPASEYSWSATSTAGLANRSTLDGSVSNCNDWSTNDVAFTGGAIPNYGVWLGEGFATYCTVRNTLLCFGDDSDLEVPLPRSPGRLAFLSASSFTASGGIAGADGICQREACEAALTGSTNCIANPGTARTFKAYLHTSTQRAWERFDLSGPSWVRVDGVQWLPDAADLSIDASHRLTGMNVRLDSSYGLPQSAWVGDVAGRASCQNWTSESAADLGTYSSTYLRTGPLAPAATQSCVAAPGRNYLFCLED